MSQVRQILVKRELHQMEARTVSVGLTILLTLAMASSAVDGEPIGKESPSSECRFRCDVACDFGGFINEQCVENCLKKCPPESIATASHAKPSG